MLKKKNYGLYTAKTKGNDYACDSFGKPYTFINSAAPYPDTKKETNPKWQGKQIITGSKVNREATELGKQFAQAIAYAPEPYIEDPKVEKVRKMGFGSNKEMSRDDLSSTIQVRRYQHHLECEAKMEAHHAAKSPPRSSSPPSATAVALAQSQAMRSTKGLASVIPTFTNEFDRVRFVPEFSTRVLPPSVRFERIHGSTRPTSTQIGEGAFDVNILKSPEQGTKKPGTYSIVHASVSALCPTMVA